MLYDTFFCYYKEMRSPLMIGHHVLPVLFWPYCLFNSKVVPVILFFVLTEFTNVWQHARLLLLKFGLDGSKLYAIVGKSWVAVFFVIRIAPSPYLFYELVNGNYSAYSYWEYSCVFLTTPLPFILNSYWFYLLFTGLHKFLEGRRAIYRQRKADAAAADLLGRAGGASRGRAAGWRRGGMGGRAMRARRRTRTARRGRELEPRGHLSRRVGRRRVSALPSARARCVLRYVLRPGTGSARWPRPLAQTGTAIRLVHVDAPTCSVGGKSRSSHDPLRPLHLIHCLRRGPVHRA